MRKNEVPPPDLATSLQGVYRVFPSDGYIAGVCGRMVLLHPITGEN